jgi:hypothetical protein
MNIFIINRIPILSILILILLSLLIISCSSEDKEPVEFGSVIICSDLHQTVDQKYVNTTGTVTSINQKTDSNCTSSIQFKTVDGKDHSLGVTVLDSFDQDISPTISVEIGQEISVISRYKMVFGSTSGFVIRDDALILAADDGSYSGALAAEDHPGITVQRDQKIIQVTKEECETLQGHKMIIQGDKKVVLTPVSSDKIVVAGQEMTIMAIRATTTGPGDNCITSDTIDYLSWVLFH